MAEEGVPKDPYDLKNLTDLQAEIMKTLKEHGIEPGAAPAVDVSKLPGMSERIQQAMEQARAMQQAWLGNMAAPAANDPVEQLARLAELHEKGVLSDTEFDIAKRKLLDENWKAD
jgi:membrane protease subunit (stomatin/prohibitin family)